MESLMTRGILLLLATLIFIVCTSCPVSELSGEALYMEGQAAFSAGDYQRARAYWEQASEKGELQSTFYLGTLYENGEGVSRDGTKALAYYERAAALGHEAAAKKVAQLREN